MDENFHRRRGLVVEGMSQMWWGPLCVRMDKTFPPGKARKRWISKAKWLCITRRRQRLSEKKRHQRKKFKRKWLIQKTDIRTVIKNTMLWSLEHSKKQKKIARKVSTKEC